MKSYLAEIFLNSLPQNFAMVLGIYAFNKQKIQAKKFWICMAISMGIIFIIRILPVSLAIHTLLGMIVLLFLGVYYLGFPIHKAIKSVFYTTIIILLIEIINVEILTRIYNKDGFKAIMADPLTNAIAGFPASMALFIIILILYLLLTKHSKRSSDNGETSGPTS